MKDDYRSEQLQVTSAELNQINNQYSTNMQPYSLKNKNDVVW